MKKKISVMLLAAITVMVLLAGCQKANEDVVEAPSSEQPQSGVVDLCVWAEEDNFPMLEQMFESFKQQYANEAQFNISLVVQPDSSAKDVILADVHKLGDVFSFPDDQFFGLMAAGVLEPVYDQEKVKSANVEGAVAAATYNGQVYAFPYTADNGYFLYYNKKYFKESDLETLDGLLAAAKKANKKVSMELNSGWYMYAFYGNSGLDFGINDDSVTNHCNWNATDTPIKGTDVAEAIIKVVENSAFLVQPDSEFVNSAKKGTVAAGVSGTWNAVGIKEAWGDDYDAVKLPTYTLAGKQVQMASFTGYKMMGVNAYSNNKEWAMKLADWLTNEQNQKIRFEQRNQGPANKNAAASDAVTSVPAIKAVIAQSEYGNLQRVGGKYWVPCTEYIDKLTSGAYKKLSLQDILDELVAGITESAAN